MGIKGKGKKGRVNVIHFDIYCITEPRRQLLGISAPTSLLALKYKTAEKNIFSLAELRPSGAMPYLVKVNCYKRSWNNIFLSPKSRIKISRSSKRVRQRQRLRPTILIFSQQKIIKSPTFVNLTIHAIAET